MPVLVWTAMPVAAGALALALMAGLALWRRGHASPWLMPGLAALAFAPLGVAVGVLGILVTRAFEAMSATGAGGMAVIAAGLAEALQPVLAGLLVTAALLLAAAAITLIARAFKKRPPDEAQPPVPIWRLFLLFVPPLFGIAGAFALLFLEHRLIGRILDALSPDGGGSLAEASGRISALLMAAIIGGFAASLYLAFAALLAALAAPMRGCGPAIWLAGIVILGVSFGTVAADAFFVWKDMRLTRAASLTGSFEPRAAFSGTDSGLPSGEPAEPTEPPAGSGENFPEPPPIAGPPSSPEPSEEPGATDATPAPGPTRRAASPRPAPTETPFANPLPTSVPEPDLGDQEEPILVTSDVKPPEAINRVQPVYPAMAKQARIQGLVILQTVINTQGRVEDVKVLRGHPLLTKAAEDAVRQWTFRPGTKDGEPVKVQFTLTVTFKLD